MRAQALPGLGCALLNHSLPTASITSTATRSLSLLIAAKLQNKAWVTWSSETSSSRPFHRPIWVFTPFPLRAGCWANTFAPFWTCEKHSDVIAGGSSKSMGHAQHSLCCQDTPCCGEPGRRNQHGKPHAARQCCTASQKVRKTKVYGLETCINLWTTGKSYKCLTGCTWCAARSPWVPARQINLVRARTGAQGLERSKCTIPAVQQTTPLRFLTRVCMIAKTTPKVHTANTKQKPS